MQALETLVLPLSLLRTRYRAEGSDCAGIGTSCEEDMRDPDAGSAEPTLAARFTS